MEQYSVTGMSCAACSARVEKAVLQVEGVTSCSVSLLTNSMGVEGTASPQAVVEAVERAGYGASLKQAKKTGGERALSSQNDEEVLADHETPRLIKRLIASLVFLIPLMYISMGHMMWDWPLPAFMAQNHVAMGLFQLLMTTAIMVINQKFFINGVRGVFHGAANMDTLVALGAGASYGYSVYALFAMTDAQLHMDMEGVMAYMHEFYFESAGMILTLITVGKLLEAKSKGRTTDALKGLMKLAPKTATLLRDEKELSVDITEVKKGDTFVVRPGETIPVDGIVTKGNGAVNEAALTGESIPVDKQPGDMVSAATMNQSGFLTCEATRVGKDTTLSQIIQMVSDATATKAPIAKAADRVSGVFVPVVLVIAGITIAVWLFSGQTVGFALARGISVLVISCPCALGLATPVAIMVGNGVGAKNGLLFKTAAALEATGRTQVVVLDKTGTITKGEPKVTDIVACGDFTKETLLSDAFALEFQSEHPLAKAIVQYAKEKKLTRSDCDDFMAVPGNGLEGIVAGRKLAGGNIAFIETSCVVSEEMKKQAEGFALEGKTPIYFSCEGKLAGVIAVADVVKEDSKQAISQLQEMGIDVVMLTGDNEQTANAIGRLVGVNQVVAGVLPDGKEDVIQNLQRQGYHVTMVGDGINDAPALTRADIGIAIGAGTDIAIDAADVVLMKSRLSDVPAAIHLSRATLRNIHENLFWAFIYNVIGIPLAAGVWIPIFGWQLNPMFGAAAMSLSSFFVISNALRLNFIKLCKINQQKKETDTMTKTMYITGMMCGHCEARVKKVLEALDGVTEAVVSHEEGTAVVTLSKEVDDETLKRTVEDQDYTVTSIQ